MTKESFKGKGNEEAVIAALAHTIREAHDGMSPGRRRMQQKLDAASRLALSNQTKQEQEEARKAARQAFRGNKPEEVTWREDYPITSKMT